MNKEIITSWHKCADELAKSLKKDGNPNSPNLFSYMVYSSFTVIEMYFTALNTVDKEDFAFSTKKKFTINMKKLSKRQIKSLYVFFLLDYFAFLKFEMDQRFFEHFPVSYEKFWTNFEKQFHAYPDELVQIGTVLEKYEYPFHPRTFLRRCGLPEEQDDLFLIEFLNEMKFELFHQFNKNVSRYVTNTSFKFS